MVCWGLVAALRDPPANERRGVILHPRWGRAFPLWVSGCHRQRSKCSRHLPLLHRDVGCGCRCARGGWAVRAGGGGLDGRGDAGSSRRLALPNGVGAPHHTTLHGRHCARCGHLRDTPHPNRCRVHEGDRSQGRGGGWGVKGRKKGEGAGGGWGRGGPTASTHAAPLGEATACSSARCYPAPWHGHVRYPCERPHGQVRVTAWCGGRVNTA